MIEMIVFDMAGTVINEHNVVYKTLHDTLFKAGIQVEYNTVLLYCAGKEKRQALIDILKGLGHALDVDFVNRCFRSFRDNLMQAYMRLQISAQPGTAEIFNYLKRHGILIVLNTGYDRATAEDLLEKLDWQIGEDIDFLVTASDVELGRPAPDMIQLAMQKFRIRHPYYVMKVGDSIVDIQEGKNADCRWIVGVTTGAHTRLQLQEAQPTHIIDHLSELLPILDESDGK